MDIQNISPDDVGILTRAVGAKSPREGFFYDPDKHMLAVPDLYIDAVQKIMTNPAWRTKGQQKILLEYAASVRWQKETAGVSVLNMTVPTDRDTQARLATAVAFSANNPAQMTQWKLPDGTFASLNSQQVSQIGQVVGTHVQSCFGVEATVAAAISAPTPTITTTAQIDEAFATIT